MPVLVVIMRDTILETLWAMPPLLALLNSIVRTIDVALLEAVRVIYQAG